MALLFDLAQQFRTELLSQERASALRMLDAFTVIYDRLRSDLNVLLERIDEAREDGEDISPAWLYQEQRFRLLLEQTERELRRFGEQAGREIAQLQNSAADQAIEHAQQLILAGIGPAPQLVITQASATLITRLNKSAVHELVGFLSDGSPLSTLLDRYGPETRQAVERALITGIGTGLSPRETARLFRKAAATTLSDALRVSRTETMRVYRETSHRSYEANADVMEGWVWHANLGDPRTCLSCVAMHGTVHRLSERLDDHPNGRCSPLPRTKSWLELGFEGIPDSRPQVERGVDWFARQTAEYQQQAMGPAKYAAYREGLVSLEDFVGRHYSSRWGTHRYERSLVRILRERDRMGGLARAAD